MGFLNGNTITVDAILTKHGRQKLANNSPLGITKFALSDDGIDYSLFNPNHPNGSANYGEAITDLPQLEAVPDDTNLMKYTLSTMDDNTLFLPHITGISKNFTLTTQTQKATLIPQTENSTDSTYHFIFNNESGFKISGGTKMDISGIKGTFLSRADIPKAAVYKASQLTIMAGPSDRDEEIIVQIIGAQSGAVDFVTVKKTSNIRKLK